MLSESTTPEKVGECAGGVVVDQPFLDHVVEGSRRFVATDIKPPDDLLGNRIALVDVLPYSQVRVLGTARLVGWASHSEMETGHVGEWHGDDPGFWAPVMQIPSTRRKIDRIWDELFRGLPRWTDSVLWLIDDVRHLYPPHRPPRVEKPDHPGGDIRLLDDV